MTERIPGYWIVKESVPSDGSCTKRHSFVISYYETGTFLTCMKCGVDLQILETVKK